MSAHDCHVGNDVTFANNAVLGGHVSVGDNVFLGGHVAIHQFVRIGEGVMMAGLSAARDDIIPFGFAYGQIASARRSQCRRLAPARRDAGRTASAAARLSRAVSRRRRIRRTDRRGRAANSPTIRWCEKIIAFIRAGGKRPLMQPRATATPPMSEAAMD